VNEYRIGDCLTVLRSLPDGFANTCVTSPPYWGLRDYGHDGQIGLEETPDAYVERMVAVFREVRRVLRDDGTLWLNLGDSYAGGSATTGGYSDKSTLAGYTGEHTKGRAMNRAETRRPTRSGLKPKDLVGIPWRVAFALQADGWYLRSDIIWHKPNPMPESVTDRPTKAHEYVFLMSKSPRYYYDVDAIKEPHSRDWQRETVGPRYMTAKEGRNDGGKLVGRGDSAGRNKRSVWTVTTRPFSGAHFACYPPELIKPCIAAGCPEGGIVLDPFFGSGTTGMVAESLGRRWFGIELNPEYEPLIRQRTAQRGLL